MKALSSSTTKGTEHSGRLFKWKLRRGRPPKGGHDAPLMYDVLNEREKKPAGRGPVLDDPALLGLIVDVAVHRCGGHVLPDGAKPPGSPFEWAEKSGRYPGLSARQLHDAYHYAPKRRGFRDKVAALFGKGVIRR
jgi:hypothetical protein